jgi:hypothetical protein
MLWTKYRWLLFLECILTLFFLITCFLPEKLIEQASGAYMELTPLDDRNGLYNVGNTFTLTPGVYQIRVKAHIPEDQFLSFEVCCESSTFNALLGNSVTMFSGQEYLDFEIYVLDKIDTAYILSGFFNGISSEALEEVSVYHTNYGSSILCCVVVMISLILNFFLVFRQKILSGQINREKQIAFWVLLAAVTLAYFPNFTDYLYFAPDTAFHLERIEGLKDTLLTGGQFPVRIQSYWLSDHGYPISLFYGDLFLYFPAILRLLGFPLMIAYKFLALLIVGTTAIITFYSLERCFCNTYAALFGSLLYTLAPFRIYNAYNLDAVGQSLGMTFLPLVFCGLYLLYVRDPNAVDYNKAKWPLIFGLSGILNSHFLTTEMTLGIIFLFVLVFIRKTIRKKTMIELLKAAGICLALNAFFWVPFLVMLCSDQYALNYLITNQLQYLGVYFASIFQVFHNKGAAQTAMYQAEPLQLGVVILLIFICFLCCMCKRFFDKEKKQNPYDNIIITLCLSMLFLFYLSTRYFPWDFISTIPGIKYLATALQFPKRLLSPASALSVFFAASFVLWLKEELEYSMFYKGLVLFLSIISVFSAAYYVNDIAFVSSPTRIYTAENMGTISLGSGEYLLDGTNWYEVSQIYKYHQPIADSGLVYSNYQKKGLNITMNIHNTTSDTLYMDVPLIRYRGYGLTSEPEQSVDSLDKPYLMKDSRQADYDLSIAIPANWAGTIQIQYQGFLIFRIAELVSLLSILGCITYYIIVKRTEIVKESDHS